MPPLDPEPVPEVTAAAETFDETIEACIDDFDECMATLERYPDSALAVALRIHLVNLLQALLEREQCTRDEVRQFLRELAREALS